MKTLIFDKNRYQVEELRDFFSRKVELSTAVTREEVFTALQSHSFDKIILNINNLIDCEIIGYINRYYPGTQLFVNLDPCLKHFMTILKEGKYTIMENQMSLNEICNILKNGRKNE